MEESEGVVMGVREIDRFLEQWQMDVRDLHRRLIPAPTPRERGRWHALRLVKANSPSYGEKASYYSAVCLETGESLPSRKRGWSGWTWRGTATPEPRLPSWSGCG